MDGQSQKSAKEDACVEHFDIRSHNWTGLYKRASFKDRLNLFVELSSEYFSPQSRILDYGCGTGVLTRCLANAGFTVHGLDASSGMIRQATESLDQNQHNTVCFEKIDPEAWNCTEESYDGVVCSSVLEYVNDDVGLLRKFSNCLKAKGVLLISIPNQRSFLGTLEDAIRRILPVLGFNRDKDVQFSWRRYTVDSISKQLSAANFELDRVVYFEVPKLGGAGVRISRMSRLGMMMLLVCRKRQ